MSLEESEHIEASRKKSAKNGLTTYTYQCLNITPNSLNKISTIKLMYFGIISEQVKIFFLDNSIVGEREFKSKCFH